MGRWLGLCAQGLVLPLWTTKLEILRYFLSTRRTLLQILCLNQWPDRWVPAFLTTRWEDLLLRFLYWFKSCFLVQHEISFQLKVLTLGMIHMNLSISASRWDVVFIKKPESGAGSISILLWLSWPVGLPAVCLPTGIGSCWRSWHPLPRSYLYLVTEGGVNVVQCGTRKFFSAVIRSLTDIPY